MEIIAAPVKPLIYNSRNLGRNVQVTERDLFILSQLYRHDKLDFEQIATLYGVTASNRRRLRNRLHILTRARFIHTYQGAFGKSPIFTLLDRGLEAFLTALVAVAKTLEMPC